MKRAFTSLVSFSKERKTLPPQEIQAPTKDSGIDRELALSGYGLLTSHKQ